MHKVLDFGAHNSEQLKEFFAASPTNTVLVTDMMGIESLKRDGLENHRRSFEILARYADRVIVLLPSGIAARLPPDQHRFPDNLIDRNATSGFPTFCAATLGNNAPHVLAKIAENQAKARHFADGVAANIGVFREAITGTQIGLVAQGILQGLAALQPRLVWTHFASWLRTQRSPECPSEFVVATALRHSLPDFLTAAPSDPNWRKFLCDRLDVAQFEGKRLAA